MVIGMTTQNYCMVNESTDICENTVSWDGNPNTWSPPAGYLMLPQETTPAKTWMPDQSTGTWVLTEAGYGQIGFTWDGTFLITNQPQPDPFEVAVQGSQTL